jgi:hypothetical protein
MPPRPIGPAESKTHEHLQELGAALRDLHRGLLDEQRIEYERERGPIPGSAGLLHLAAYDPGFAWLRTLSLLIVDLDGLLGQDDGLSDDEARALREELEELFSSTAPGTFWERCVPNLQAPVVAMAYGRVRALVAKLPKVAPADVAAELHAKHRWAVARRLRGQR